MTDQPSASAAGGRPHDVTGPYVVEHYGFAAPDGGAPSRPPRATAAAEPSASAVTVPRRTGDRRRRMLAAGALGLVLTGGIGGVAAAAADSSPAGRGDDGRAGALVQVRDGGGPRAGADGQAGPR
jgi:hypothetical protein